MELKANEANFVYEHRDCISVRKCCHGFSRLSNCVQLNIRYTRKQITFLNDISKYVSAIKIIPYKYIHVLGKISDFISRIKDCLIRYSTEFIEPFSQYLLYLNVATDTKQC